MKKTVLYIAPSSGLGGAETFLKTTFISHHKEQIKPIYLLFQKGPLFDWLTERGALIEVLPQRPRLSRPWTIWQVHQFIQQVIQKYSVDLVHSTMAYGALFSSFAANHSNLPHVWFQHGPASGWMDQLAALLPHHAVLVNSDFTRLKQQQLEKPFSFFISKKRKIHKINLGVETPLLSPSVSADFKKTLLKKHSLPDDTVIFAMACRLQKWKGVHLLIEAVERLESEKAFAVFIWGDTFDSDEYVDDLKKRSQNRPLFFEGPIANVPLAFSACDVVINASIQPEPFGLTLIEALSVGAALIGPSEGGPKEIIMPEITGRLFTPRSAESLRDQIQWMLAHPDLRKKMQEAARFSYEKHYTNKQMTERLESIYQDLSAVNR